MIATLPEVCGENTFCGSAGLEELKHVYNLVSELSDKELKLLVKTVGIKFLVSEKLLDRCDYEVAVDGADKEDFYREYNRIILVRNIKAGKPS